MKGQWMRKTNGQIHVGPMDCHEKFNPPAKLYPRINFGKALDYGR